MRAEIIKEYGAVDQFEITEVSSPEIEDGQILIQNRASSVNPVDTLVRQGKLKLLSARRSASTWCVRWICSSMSSTPTG